MTRCRSMTGFGRGEAESDGLRVAAEVRSVNHRFADVQVKTPRAWMSLESAVAARVRDRVTRGRVDVHLRRDATGGAGRLVAVDTELARAYAQRAAELTEQLGLAADLSADALFALPGVVELTDAPVDAEAELPLVEAALAAALDSVLAMREEEGSALDRAIREHLRRVEDLIDEVEAEAAQGPDQVLARVRKRLERLLGDVELDPQRLAQEVAHLADRAAIDEELARLRSHLDQARALLDGGGPVGRRLDFLVQEFGREINTIGSKAQGTEIAPRVVELKSTLEKVREQVANLE